MQQKNGIFLCDLYGTYTGNHFNREKQVKDFVSKLTALKRNHQLETLYFAFCSSEDFEFIASYVLELSKYLPDDIPFGVHICGKNMIKINDMGFIDEIVKCYKNSNEKSVSELQPLLEKSVSVTAFKKDIDYKSKLSRICCCWDIFADSMNLQQLFYADDSALERLLVQVNDKRWVVKDKCDSVVGNRLYIMPSNTIVDKVQLNGLSVLNQTLDEHNQHIYKKYYEKQVDQINENSQNYLERSTELNSGSIINQANKSSAYNSKYFVKDK